MFFRNVLLYAGTCNPSSSPHQTRSMTITVRLFALGRELVGRAELALVLAAGATANDVVQHLQAEYPAFERLPSFVLAVNNDYAERDEPLHDGDEVAIIPPVSGG
jgi:molybdopterin converting factor subunit 1